MVTPSKKHRSVLHKSISSYEMLSIILLIIIVVFGAYEFYQYKKGSAVAEEPAPTVESFRKNYVSGCELKPTTFKFTDGSSLTGEFAECPAEREMTFFATTTILKFPSKKSLVVHHIIVRDKESTYPVVSVYFPQDVNAQDALREGALKLGAKGTSTPPTGPVVSAKNMAAAASSSSEITLTDIGKSGTIATVASDGTGITSGMVVQQGYLMALYSKTAGYLFDQNTLKYEGNN